MTLCAHVARAGSIDHVTVRNAASPAARAVRMRNLPRSIHAVEAEPSEELSEPAIVALSGASSATVTSLDRPATYR